VFSVGPRRGYVFCGAQSVPRPCKGDSLRKQRSQENENTTEYNRGEENESLVQLSVGEAWEFSS
jgi:hypothetical protein